MSLLTHNVVALGTDPNGTERRLAIAETMFEDGKTIATAEFDLQLYVRYLQYRRGLHGSESFWYGQLGEQILQSPHDRLGGLARL